MAGVARGLPTRLADAARPASSIGVVNEPLPPPMEGGVVDWMYKVEEEGKPPLPPAPSSHHHYVAQFQLAKFKGKGRLWQLDTQDGTCDVVTPKEAAWSSNLYTVESTTGEHDGIIEGFYAIVENFAAPALKRFLADPANLS